MLSAIFLGHANAGDAVSKHLTMSMLLVESHLE